MKIHSSSVSVQSNWCTKLNHNTSKEFILHIHCKITYFIMNSQGKIYLCPTIIFIFLNMLLLTIILDIAELFSKNIWFHFLGWVERHIKTIQNFLLSWNVLIFLKFLASIFSCHWDENIHDILLLSECNT
jgi:hypothetical protein